MGKMNRTPKYKTHGCPYSDLLVLPIKAQQACSTFGHFFFMKMQLKDLKETERGGLGLDV